MKIRYTVIFTLLELEQRCFSLAKQLHRKIICYQNNIEGEIVTFIQNISCKGIIINAAAYAHTSIALLDVLRAKAKPVIEVHISNVFQREDFRHHSYISQIATGVIYGLRIQGYELALRAMDTLIV